MKILGFCIIIFSFIFIPVSHSQTLNTEQLKPEQLKKVTGKAGIVAESGEIVIKIKNNNISKALDSDSVSKAGINLSSSDDEYSVLRFKPIQKTKEYSNKNLSKVFGDQIGNAGLKNNNTDTNIKETETLLSKTNFLFPINLSGISSAFTLIDIYNEKGLNTSETKFTLPAAEAETDPFKKNISIFTNQNGKTDKQNILTIESGTAKTAILGGTAKIINNFND